ncbi:hypothetical protein MARHY1550 [Marinobacter nauticus ATCC 49840]|nr:hypothetical protein MARHY1550 [Marinobacter nauticus ATCC 49840]
MESVDAFAGLAIAKETNANNAKIEGIFLVINGCILIVVCIPRVGPRTPIKMTDVHDQ